MYHIDYMTYIAILMHICIYYTNKHIFAILSLDINKLTQRSVR